MSQQKLLIDTVQSLTREGIDYMLTGSVVSSLQGEPRSTHDIDMVIELRPDDVSSFLALFPDTKFYVAEEAIRDAIRRSSMFNVISLDDGDKLDFWILTDTPFDQSRFTRRRAEHIFGIAVFVSTPEDTILMKLSWAKSSGSSEKQFTDALRVYEVQGRTLDEAYLDRWATTLSVTPWLERIRREAEPIE